MSELPSGLDLPDFAGKLVWLLVSPRAPAESGGILLEFAEFVNRDGALLLTGRQLLFLGRRWGGYRHACVAWGSVYRYVVFESFEEYRSRVRQLSAPTKAAVRR